MSSTCPSCGAAATGKFCTNCGAALQQPTCPTCQATLTPGTRFCSECGTQVGAAVGEGQGAGMAAPWKMWVVAAAVAVVGLLAVVVWQSSPRPPAGQQGTAAQPQVDFSSMPPQLRADSLFNTVMWAHSRGDQAAVMNFAPMAIDAYAALGTLSSDARYHVGTLYSVAGPMEMALVQADSLELVVPGHLFSAMLRGSVARVRRDTVALRGAYQAFLDHYDDEMAAGRTEYLDHQASVEAFLTEARATLQRGDSQ